MAFPFFGRAARPVVDELGELGRDLLTLEINTILKDTMTAEPTPPWPHAVLSLLREYAGFLADQGWPVMCYINCEPSAWAVLPEREAQPRPSQVLGDRPAELDRNALRLDLVSVDRLRWAARGCSLALQIVPDRTRQAVIADRILGNCDELKAILRRVSGKLLPADIAWLPALSAAEDAVREGRASTGPDRAELITLLGDPDRARRILVAPEVRDTAMLRKMWEIGTEEVVAQTVVHLDGDVVTRFRRGLDGPDQGAPVMEAHRMGVDVALSSWRHLVDTALRLVRPLGLP
jgi:hypothetical protein